MVKKSHLIEKKNSEHNQLWEWNETPAVKKALKELNKISKENVENHYS